MPKNKSLKYVVVAWSACPVFTLKLQFTYHKSSVLIRSPYTSSAIRQKAIIAEAEVTLRLTVSQSVSQYVLVSSPLWDLRPDIMVLV
jgi:hypothetical protein